MTKKLLKTNVHNPRNRSKIQNDCRDSCSNNTDQRAMSYYTCVYSAPLSFASQQESRSVLKAGTQVFTKRKEITRLLPYSIYQRGNVVLYLCV